MRILFTYSLFFLMLVRYAHASSTEKVFIQGKIISSANREPVKEAEVFLSPGRYSAVTDKKGEYRIQNIKKGEYVLSVICPGFKMLSQIIRIDSNTVSLDFSLDISFIELKQVTINADDDNPFGISRLRSVEGTSIYAGKKSEVIRMNHVSANLAANNSRQIYSKVPGLNIWESDGAGIQLGIGGRGLSPNRVSHFNTRQNGYDISADALGYPESYYTPPAEAMEKIEIVRGAASLQYGTQFGGMINFRLKKGNEEKPFELVSRQTLGSFRFFNTFNSIGGTSGKWNYYVFHQYKKGDGWRPNSRFNSHVAHSSLEYRATAKLTFTAEYTFMDYLARQPGGLTDPMFDDDPRQSLRSRNWFHVNWNLAAVSIDYKAGSRTTINMRNFGLLAGRDALGSLGAINRADDPSAERNLLQDKYANAGSELRVIHRYSALKKNAVLLVGSRYYRGFTDRKQGYGSSGEGPDFHYLNPCDLEHSDYDFPSRNIAAFAENIFYMTPVFSITPGIRFEHIYTAAEGYYREEYRDFAGNIIYQNRIEDNRASARSFVLLGAGLSYKKSEKAELYANLSQNYRSINFNDMRIVNPSLRVDPNLKDENGYSSDLGIRGSIGQMFNYDVSLFLLSYNDRIGSVIKVDSVLFNTYRYRTNISDSRSYGMESFLELDIWKMIKGKNAKAGFSVFTNVSCLDARYINSEEAAFENKKVELVPSVLIKTGITFRKNEFRIAYQYSCTGEHYTDATNAVFTSNAVNGIIPFYYVMDLSAEYTWKLFSFSGGINNLSDNMYFTRRADGYPGPGIIPSDGRSMYITLQIKI